MNNRDYTEKRAERVLFVDKLISPINFKQTIKLEIYSALKDFMNISPDNIKMTIAVSEKGDYKIDFSVITNQIKPVGVVL